MPSHAQMSCAWEQMRGYHPLDTPQAHALAEPAVCALQPQCQCSRAPSSHPKEALQQRVETAGLPVSASREHQVMLQQKARVHKRKGGTGRGSNPAVSPSLQACTRTRTPHQNLQGTSCAACSQHPDVRRRVRDQPVGLSHLLRAHAARGHLHTRMHGTGQGALSIKEAVV